MLSDDYHLKWRSHRYLSHAAVTKTSFKIQKNKEFPSFSYTFKKNSLIFNNSKYLHCDSKVSPYIYEISFLILDKHSVSAANKTDQKNSKYFWALWQLEKLLVLEHFTFWYFYKVCLYVSNMYKIDALLSSHSTDIFFPFKYDAITDCWIFLTTVSPMYILFSLCCAQLDKYTVF